MIRFLSFRGLLHRSLYSVLDRDHYYIHPVDLAYAIVVASAAHEVHLEVLIESFGNQDSPVAFPRLILGTQYKFGTASVGT